MRILALIDDSPSAGPVRRTAAALADLLAAEVETITADEDGGSVSADPLPALLRALAADDVVMGVLGTRSLPAKPEPIGHVAAGLLTEATVPLVLVSPTDGLTWSDHPRLLLPLDGAVATDQAVVPLAGQLSEAGANVVAFHVYSSESIPPFLDSDQDLETLAEEFLLTHLPGCGDDCELRIGEPSQEIIDRVSDGDIDGVVVAWQRRLDSGRATVIRRLLRELRVPLLVVPIIEAGGPSG